MIKLSTVGALLGIATGLLAILTTYDQWHGVIYYCPQGFDCPIIHRQITGPELASFAIGVGLILSSTASLLIGRFVLYASVLLSALTAVGTFLTIQNWDPSVYFSPFAWPTVALSLMTCAADVVAIRTRSTMSEQTNPMNLPVFG